MYPPPFSSPIQSHSCFVSHGPSGPEQDSSEAARSVSAQALPQRRTRTPRCPSPLTSGSQPLRRAATGVPGRPCLARPPSPVAEAPQEAAGTAAGTGAGAASRPPPHAALFTAVANATPPALPRAATPRKVPPRVAMATGPGGAREGRERRPAPGPGEPGGGTANSRVAPLPAVKTAGWSLTWCVHASVHINTESQNF